MNNKERILKAARGEMVDKIPYAPREDLWHTANARAGTLPERHRGRSADEIARAEGWTLHKIVPEFDKPAGPEDVLHRGIGLFRLKEYLFDFEFSSDVSIEVKDESNEEEDMTRDVLNEDHLKIVEDVRTMVDEGLDPKELINKGMLPAMEVIGARFRDGTVFIPEVLESARAMNAAVEFLESHLTSGDQQSHGKILIGTVKGDMHDIGKNMVIAMLKGVGFDLIDIGVNVPVDEFVAQVQKHRPDILGLSALLTTTMPQMEEVIRTLSEAGMRDSLKIKVGGAPVNEKFAIDIGADGYAVDAGEAVDVAKSLLHIN